MKVKEVLTRAMEGKISWGQAAQVLGYSSRHIRRLRKKIQAQGFSCMVDKRLGKPSYNRVSEATVREVLRLFRDQYYDFNTKHFHEYLERIHDIHVGYTWVKTTLQNAGYIQKESRRNTHRKKRERKPLPGMMIHLDASTHAWFGERHPNSDLLLTLDDATSEIFEGLMCEQESTLSSMSILKSTVEKKGIFCSLYTDRGSHFVVSHKKNMKPLSQDQNERLTQVQKALAKLGTKLIPAGSPQARGRGERMWQTFQGRLPQELRLNHITTFEDANKYLREVFIPKINELFSVPAKHEGTAFIAPHPSLNLERVFSIESTRTARADNTIQYKNLILQIPESIFRCSFAKCHIQVFELMDGSIELSYGPHTLATYTQMGELKINELIPKKSIA